MGTLLTKYWWYQPNQYTTTFKLIAVFNNGTSTYTFNKTAESWVAVGSHDSRLVIILPNANNGNRFIVRAYDNDVFVSLNAEYSNAYSQSIAKPANMSRMVFDKSFYSTHLFEPNCAYDNPYDLFNDSDLHDIYFTNLTETITLPNKNSNYGHWYGWGAYNQTKPYSMLNKINDLDNLYRMPLSWIYSWQLAGFPTVGINNSTSSHPGISKFYEVPMVDHRVYMVPLYHNEKPYYDIDTNDYGEPVIPDTPTPPISSEPNYLCFTANKAGATLRLVGMVNPDYDGDLVELEYSTDGETWHDFEITTDLNADAELNSISSTLTFSNIGDKVYFRGNNILGTSAVDIENDEVNFTYVFAGGEGTNTEDNEFAVSGDIQTIVDKTGQDKTHGQFGGDGCGLFSNLGVVSDDEFPGILITTAPDLTATSLVPGKYCYLFMGQTLLEHPATMPNFTTNQLPHMSMDDMDYGAYAFVSMYYGCTSLQEGCDFSTLTANTYSDVLVIAGNLEEIYEETTFNITDDNGLTLNGFEGISFPFTATMEMDGETMTKVINSYMFASDICTNTNGFSTITLYISTDNGSIRNVNPYYSYENDYDTHIGEISIPSSAVGTTIEVEFDPNNDYTVTKWQSSTDGETWIDIPNSDSNTLEITIPDTDYYYKVVTVSAQPNWVETSKVEDPNYADCYVSSGLRTGFCTKRDIITYTDQNQYSSTYNQTYTDYEYKENIEDTVSCPLSPTKNHAVQIIANTEFNDNGTIITNNTDKVDIKVVVGRENYLSIDDGGVILPFNDNIVLGADDTTFSVWLVAYPKQGYAVDSVSVRTSPNDNWNPYRDSEIEYTTLVWAPITYNTTINYVEFQIQLCEAIHRTVTIRGSYDYNNGEETGVVSFYNPTGSGINETELIVQPLSKDYYINPHFNVNFDYEINQIYVRYSDDSNWIAQPMKPFKLDLEHDYFELKYMLIPPTVTATVHFATESYVNDDFVYNIDDTLGVLYDAFFAATDSNNIAQHINMSLGNNTLVVPKLNEYWSMNFKIIPSLSSQLTINDYTKVVVRGLQRNTGEMVVNYVDTTSTIQTDDNNMEYAGFYVGDYYDNNYGFFRQPLRYECLIIVNLPQ